MQRVFVTTSAFGADEVLERGQAFFVPVLAEAGADGVEIRRELFGDEQPLVELGDVIQKADLSAVYSAPVAVWMEDGSLNERGIRSIIVEAMVVGAEVVKFSLGHFVPGVSDLAALKQLGEMQAVLERVSEADLDAFVKEMVTGKRLFVIGEGRSGLMAKSFAMRLMHLGAHVYVVGETITPALQAGDAVVAVSGSGTTKSVLGVAKKARELGCPVLAVTTNPESELGQAATFALHVPAATKYRREGEAPSIQPLGSLFDQCAHILFDAVCLRYAALQEQDTDSAFARHSNLE